MSRLENRKNKIQTYLDEKKDSKIRKIHYYDKRISSLDTIRGITIAIMIIYVCQGTNGSNLEILSYSRWNGFGIIEMLMPFFILCSGASIPLSFQNYAEKSEYKKYFFNVLTRATVFFFCGIIINWLAITNNKFVITGVFQMISIGYLITGLLYGLFKYLRFKDFFLIFIFLILGLIIAFSVRVFFYGNEYDTRELYNRINKMIFGFYAKDSFDKEGLLTMFASLQSWFISVIAGMIYCIKLRSIKKIKNIRTKGRSVKNIKKGKRVKQNAFFELYFDLRYTGKIFILLLICGAIFSILASVISVWTPINRSTWSISFVVFSTGLYFSLSSIIFAIEDLFGFKILSWIFKGFGTNAIIFSFFGIVSYELLNKIYIKSIYVNELLPFNEWLISDLIVPYIGEKYASLIYALLILLLMWSISQVLKLFKVVINV